MKTQNHIEITYKEKKQLIKAQQGELDGVMVYRSLAEIIMKKSIDFFN